MRREVQSAWSITMTSASTFLQRLTQIDDLIRPDHYYLDSNDDCYFLGEYTARKGFAFSATNQLILNFKKTVDRRGTGEWRHKDRAPKAALDDGVGMYALGQKADSCSAAKKIAIRLPRRRG